MSDCAAQGSKRGGSQGVLVKLSDTVRRCGDVAPRIWSSAAIDAYMKKEEVNAVLTKKTLGIAT
jgi:hypothetical protein